MTGEKRRSYTPQFKNEAVRLITDEGQRIAEVARNLGVNATMLGRWKREAQEEDAFPGKRRMKPMEGELRRMVGIQPDELGSVAWALSMASGNRRPDPGLIQHYDQSIQHACH